MLHADNSASSHDGNRDGTWIDRYYSWGWLGKLPIPVVGFLSGAFCFLVGLALAYTYGFQHDYITTGPMWLGAFGVGWVSAWIRWGMLNLPGQIDYIRSCFIIDDRDYQALTGHWLRRLRNTRAALGISLGVVLITWMVVYHGLLGKTVAPPSDPRLLFTPAPSHLFPLGWYLGNKPMNMILFDVQALPCALVFGTGLWLLGTNAMFLLKFKELPVVPMPGLLVARLRRITAFYLVIACSWFVGVAIVGIVFFKHLDIVAAMVLLVTGSLGLVTFFAPQVVFHSFLVRASALIAHHVNELFRCEFGSMFVGSQLSITGIQHHPSALEKLANMAQITQPCRMWVYEVKDVTILLFGQGLGVLALFAKPYVLKVFGA